MASNNVSSMSCEELCSFLEDKKIPDDVITTIKDQDIDGDVFSNLSDEEISEITKKMGTRKKLKQLQENDSRNYTRVKYGEKNYCLSDLPSSTDYVVVEAAKEIEGQLRLQDLGEDLTTLGRFVRIAHFGVVGHPELQIKVRTSFRNVFELCLDTAHTLNDFKRTLQEALESLQTAYRYLSEALEEQALKMLLSLQEMSSRIKNEASALSKKCNEQSTVIKETGDTILQKRAEVIEERKENESKIDLLTYEKHHTYEEIQEAESEKEEAQTDLKSAYSEKEEAIEEFIKETKYNQKQNQDYIDKKHEESEQLASHHSREVAKMEEEYASNINENEKQYLEKLMLNKLQLSNAANQQYEAVIAKNINDLSEKLEKILNAEKALKTENKNALDEKNKSDQEAKLVKTLKIEKLEEDYKHELEKLEKDVEDFKKYMQSTLNSHATKIEDIKEKQQKNQQAIDESKKSKRQAQRKMHQVIEQITQCKSRAEIHKVTEKSLHQAMGALNEIEAIMINVGNFWKDVEGLCASVTGQSMKRQVDMLSSMDPDKRKVIWQSQAFKVDALNFYGKWIALKAVCTTASGNVNSALDEVQRYMVENPDEDKAFQSIQDMAGEFLKELPSSEEQ